MSKEKQCECCHEWWYDSDIKEDLCPNCYDYFKQLKQQLDKKDKMHLLDEQEFQHYCAYKLIETEIKGCLDREKQLEQELAKLKEKYIIPKFQLGQTIFTANKPNECIYELKIVSIHIERSEFCDRKFNSLVYRAERIKDGCIGGYSEDELFATEQEAQAKLKEVQGDE